MTRHDKAHYFLSGALLLLLIVTISLEHNSRLRNEARFAATANRVANLVPGQVRKIVKGSWPGLGQTKTIALGEALAGPPLKVALFCGGSECQDIRADVDDALQIAGWTGEFETAFFGGDETGLLIGPPGSSADKFAAALSIATSAPAKIVGMRLPNGADVGVIFARAPR